MLKWPMFDLPFEPLLSYWLGGISIYDIEETLGVALSAYDPNDEADREVVIRDLVKLLEASLKLPEFDFSG